MAKLLEVIDSITDESFSEEVKETIIREAKALEDSNKQLYARAKKAEGFEQDKEGKWNKAEKPAPEPEKKPEAAQPSEPDYGKLAFLKSEGVSHPDDRKVVMDEAKRLNLPIDEVLGMEHIKTKLKGAKTQREAEAGMPEGSGGKGGGSNKTSVDYWKDRKKADGTYDTPTDPELAKKVIDARIKQESTGSMFSEDLF